MSYTFDSYTYPNPNYYYTSSTANSVQSTPENSLGGYPSTNGVYTATTTTAAMTTIQTDALVTALPTEVTGLAQIGIEIVNYTGASALELTGLSRGKVPNSTPIGLPHTFSAITENVFYLTIDNLFNPLFDNTYKQYRCIAIENPSSVEIENVEVVLIQDNDADVTIDIGIEVPSHDYRTGTVTSTTSNLIITNNAFAGLFADNYFAGSFLTVTAGGGIGETSVISSYTGATGTFVLEDALVGVAVASTFAIDAAPCQRILNQLTKPLANSRFFGFLSEGGSAELGYNGIREHGSQFLQNDVFYLWICRTLEQNVKAKANTAAVILLKYTVI